MKASHKAVVYFFNSTGTLSFETRKSGLKISKFLILWNSISFPLIYALLIFITRMIGFENTMKKELVDIEKTSKFLIMTVYSLAVQYALAIACCIYIQVWKSKNILDLFVNCFKIFHLSKLAKKLHTCKELERKYFRTLIFMWAFCCFVHFEGFFSAMEINWESFFIYVVMHWNDNIVLYFMVLVYFVLLFFLFLLISVNSDLENSARSSSTKVFDYDTFLCFFVILFELVDKFQKSFGLLLSIGTSYIISVVIVKVSKPRYSILNLKFSKFISRFIF